jgi:hypothetical protein
LGGRIGRLVDVGQQIRRNRLVICAASSSVSARLSTEPLRQWMCHPRASLVMSYPIACYDGGHYEELVSRTITE